MTQTPAREVLRQGLADLTQARAHLAYSFQQIAGLAATLEGATPRELESVEAFCSRFARTVDLLVNKVLRALDRVELLPAGTLLDVVHRAEKRGLIPDGADLREMKDVRNIVAHDYAGTRMAAIFSYLREQHPALEAICERTAAHAVPLLQQQS